MTSKARIYALLLLAGASILTSAGSAQATQPERGGKNQKPPKAIPLDTLARLPARLDASPLPNYTGSFVSLGASGVWHRPSEARLSFSSSVGSLPSAPAQDCSREALIFYASQAPWTFEPDKNGLLYGVETHTPETRMTTRYWDMPGFNSCALVVYAILKQAGCQWARYTANAKAIYDMAYKNGWRPSERQEGGCMVAWNSKWKGWRPRIGDLQKQASKGGTQFRHVGITTGSWLSVDNSGWLSRPVAYITYRPITYEPPIFLCPPDGPPKSKAGPARDGK